MKSSSAERYFAWLLRHRWIVLAAAGLVVTAAGFSALGIRADYGVEQFFKVGDPARQVYEDFGERFPREDRQVTLFWDIGEPLNLRTYRQMEQAAQSPPDKRRRRYANSTLPGNEEKHEP